MKRRFNYHTFTMSITVIFLKFIFLSNDVLTAVYGPAITPQSSRHGGVFKMILRIFLFLSKNIPCDTLFMKCRTVSARGHRAFLRRNMGKVSMRFSSVTRDHYMLPILLYIMAIESKNRSSVSKRRHLITSICNPIKNLSNLQKVKHHQICKCLVKFCQFEKSHTPLPLFLLPLFI